MIFKMIHNNISCWEKQIVCSSNWNSGRWLGRCYNNNTIHSVHNRTLASFVFLASYLSSHWSENI